ncbi:hypothetical protein RHECNPAF_2940071 [Rhizobium etli CNPAF512]|nr:hypothetical protein RHECNPAF_2940071 [Rhizobium etli CNPAF512]
MQSGLSASHLQVLEIPDVKLVPWYRFFPAGCPYRGQNRATNGKRGEPFKEAVGAEVIFHDVKIRAACFRSDLFHTAHSLAVKVVNLSAQQEFEPNLGHDCPPGIQLITWRLSQS